MQRNLCDGRDVDFLISRYLVLVNHRHNNENLEVIRIFRIGLGQIRDPDYSLSGVHGGTWSVVSRYYYAIVGNVSWLPESNPQCLLEAAPINNSAKSAVCSTVESGQT
jgi:hypothetical protein